MVLPPELADLYRRKLQGYKQTISKMIQETVCLFIKDGHWERHLNRMRILYRKKNQVLLAELEETFHDQITVIGEKSGLHILVQVNSDKSEDELIQTALKKGVKVYPTSIYHSKKVNDPIILMGYGGLSETDIKKGIRLLKKAWL